MEVIIAVIQNRPLLLFSLLWLAPPAWAAPPDDEARLLLTQGQAALTKGECKGAVETLQQAAKKALDGPLRGEILRLMGAAYSCRTMEPQARRAFRESLENDPLSRLRPDLFPPAVMDLFAEVHRGVLGTLSVTADRKGVKLLVNGKEVGEVPSDLDYPVGSYKVQCVSDDGNFASDEVDVVIHAGGSHMVKAVMSPRMGDVTVLSNPSGALVYVNGEQVGMTPLERLRLPVGSHQVVLRHPQGGLKERRIEVRGETALVIQNHLLPLEDDRPALSARSLKLWAYVTLGVGAALGGTGIALGAVAAGDESRFQAGGDEVVLDNITYRAAEDLRGQAESKALGANVCFGLAITSLAASVVLFILDATVTANQDVPPTSQALAP